MGQTIAISDIRAAQAGDGEAFARLLEPLEARLYQLALGVTGNREDAEDAWQNAMLRAWKGIGRMRDPASFGTWMTKIVVNESRRLTRGKTRNERFLTPLPQDDLTQDLVHGMAHDSTQDLANDLTRRLTVLSYLRRLPEEQREAVILRFWLDLTLDEVAAVTGVPTNTAKTRLYRGIEALKRLITREVSESERAHGQ